MPLDSDVISKLCVVAIDAREARDRGDDWQAPGPEDFRGEIQVIVRPAVQRGDISESAVDRIFHAVMEYALGKSSAIEAALAEVD